MTTGHIVTPEDAREILGGLERAYEEREDPPGVCVVSGSGVKVAVRDGHLWVSDGEGWFRRERRFNRATSGLSRVVVTGQSGYVTVDALRWCHEAGVTVVTLGADRLTLAESPRGTLDARLLRVQAAPPDGLAAAVARLLLGAKLAGQYRVMPSDTIEALAAAMETAGSVDECRQLEAAAANLYFNAWAGTVTMRFATRDRRRIPEHWLGFETRRSPLAGGASNRKAATPINALLNLLYALGAVECKLSAVALGLLPELGFVHADAKGRDNLSYDLLEPVRPEIDRWLLHLLEVRTFVWSDFIERTDGSIRIGPALREEIVATMQLWAEVVAPWAERLTHLLGEAVSGKWSPTTPLTKSRARRSAAVVKARKAGLDVIRPTSIAQQPSLWSCTECGGPVTNSRHVRCEACQATDPRQKPEVRGRRGRAISAARRREKLLQDAQGIEWDQVAAVLPTMTLREIIERAGVAKSTASAWRNGITKPPPGAWAELVGVEGLADR